MQNRDAAVELSGALRTIAVGLMKIANDLRLLASGSRTGLNEIELPATQPGSSIMPGKVNPVIPEAVNMVAAQIIGYDAAVAIAAMNGNLDLNVMMPVIAHDLLESIELTASASRVFAEKCVRGIKANVERCRQYAELTGQLVTALAPVIGYDKAAAVFKKAVVARRVDPADHSRGRALAREEARRDSGPEEAHPRRSRVKNDRTLRPQPGAMTTGSRSSRDAAGPATCRITTRGRKTGRPHAVTIWFVVGAEEQRVYLGTLRMGRDWPRNVAANPEVIARHRGLAAPGPCAGGQR